MQPPPPPPYFRPLSPSTEFNSLSSISSPPRLSADLKCIEVDAKFENPTGDETDTSAAEYQKFADYLLSVEEERDCRYASYDIRSVIYEPFRTSEFT